MAASNRSPITTAALVIALLTAGLVLGLRCAEQRGHAGAGLAPTADDTLAAPDAPAELEWAGAPTRAAADAGAIPAAPRSEPQPAPLTAPEPTVAAPLGRIFGRVLGPDGQPAVGRAVRILRTNGTGIETATTDADGGYDQRDLEATRYHVSTQPSDAELTELGLVSGFAGLEWLAQSSVLLAAGEEVQVDLGFPPERPIRVHGRVTGGDAETSAVLQWVPEDEFGYNLASYTPTRADGTYEVILSRPGPYHISAIVSPGSIRVDSDVHVPDAGEFEHDIALPRGRLSVSVTAGGVPIRGAVVDLMPRAGIPPIPGMSCSSFMKRTSDEGRVDVGFLRPGTWSVAVHDAKLSDGTPLAAQHATVHIDDTGAPAELEFALYPGIALKGNVTAEDGTPLAGAIVLVFDAAGEPLNALQGPRSNKTGEFTLTGLAPGAYSLVAARGDRWSTAAPFTLHEGEPTPAITVAVAPTVRLVVDRSDLSEAAWIDVRDERGRLFSALLDWNLFSGHYGRHSSTVEVRYTLPAGNYTVRAVGANAVIATATVALAAGETRRVALR
jgi:hypothetical protein